MQSIHVTLKPNHIVTKCPMCGNHTQFTAISRQVSEDCCEVWVECKCGYDPTEINTSQRFESVMGELSRENVVAAISCWNYAI